MEPVVKMVGLGVGGTSVATSTAYGVYEFSRSKDLRELLISEGQNPINEEDSTNWETIVSKYEAENNTIKFSDFDLTDVSTKANKFKEKCFSSLKTSTSEVDEINKLKNPTKTWCTKNPENLADLLTQPPELSEPLLKPQVAS